MGAGNPIRMFILATFMRANTYQIKIVTGKAEIYQNEQHNYIQLDWSLSVNKINHKHSVYVLLGNIRRQYLGMLTDLMAPIGKRNCKLEYNMIIRWKKP